MKVVWTKDVCLFLAGFCSVLCLGTFPSRSEATLPVQEVIKKAVSRAGQVEAASKQPGYTYTKCTVTEELDASGNVRDRKEKVYRVVFQNGSTYLRLLEVNGRAPASGDLKKQSENDLNVRQLLGQPKSATGKGSDNFLTPELVARFDFELIGETPLNGRMAYQVSFKPKNPEPPVHHIVDKLLNRLSGTIWIDAQEFEVAKANVELRSEVNLLGGVAGSLKKLAYTITRTRVADGLWFSTSSAGNFEGRKLVEALRVKTKSQSNGFRPLS
jgi:hypothetical protein